MAAGLLAGLGAAGCAPRLMALPAGPGEPASDGPAALAQATIECRRVSTLVAQAALNGSIGSQRVRGRLDLGLAPPGSARLELVAPFGQPFFYFVAHDGSATLWLTRENRVVRDASPGTLLEALTGIPLGPAELRATLVGCVGDLNASAARRSGDNWRIVEDGGLQVHLRRPSTRAPWQIVAVVRRAADGAAWRVEYRDFANALPQKVLLFAPDRFRVELTLSQVDRSRTLPAEVFHVEVPATVRPMTIDELRRTGPLAGSGGDGG
jgi:hypothetical protein